MGGKPVAFFVVYIFNINPFLNHIKSISLLENVDGVSAKVLFTYFQIQCVREEAK